MSWSKLGRALIDLVLAVAALSLLGWMATNRTSDARAWRLPGPRVHATVAAGPTGRACQADPARDQEVARILGDSVIWGDDMPRLLAHLEAFSRESQKRVAVFQTMAVGMAPLRDDREAERAATRFNATLRSLREQPTPLFDRFSPDAAPVAEVRAFAMPDFADDGSARLAVDSMELLAPGLTVDTVTQRLGAAESVTTEVIQSDRDSRPVILTIHNYAHGSIGFAESDIAPRPGFVDRVVLDVDAVADALTGSSP